MFIGEKLSDRHFSVESQQTVDRFYWSWKSYSQMESAAKVYALSIEKQGKEWHNQNSNAITNYSLNALQDLFRPILMLRQLFNSEFQIGIL